MPTMKLRSSASGSVIVVDCLALGVPALAVFFAWLYGFLADGFRDEISLFLNGVSRSRVRYFFCLAGGGFGNTCRAGFGHDESPHN